MRLLIVDRTAEGQSECARRIEAFSQADVETLDLRVKLVLDRDMLGHIYDADILLLGPGLGESAPALARNALAQVAELKVIMIVGADTYLPILLRAAHDAGVRKVLAENASHLDLLQELIGIHADYKRSGRVREGRVVCVTHAKGGTGATTLCAALGEVCSVNRRRTLLWDLDVETRDLCRSLTVSGAEARVVTGWVNGSKDISRDSIEEAVVAISQDVSILMPPDSMAEAMDLVCHMDGAAICQRVVELARVMYDVIIIDTAGRIGPATGALMRAADELVIVIDDTVLGLTALDLFLSYVKALVISTDRINLVVNGYSGSVLAVPQIEAELEPVHALGPRTWRLPPVPVDAKGSLWPGSGKTLYSMGQRATRATLEELSRELGIITRGGRSQESRKGSAWWERLLTRGGNEDESFQDVVPK